MFPASSILIASISVLLAALYFTFNPTQVEEMAALASRSVVKKVLAVETAEGAGATVRRSIGTMSLRNLSPFLM
jgi:Na+-translocating ferredoxin:NAD+ oxidoreductase RnfG subunit